MSKYIQQDFKLTNYQLKKLGDCISKRKKCVLSLKAEDLGLNGNVPLLITSEQMQQIDKAKINGKGLRISLSPDQLMDFKTGGILPVLVPLLIAAGSAIVGSLAGYATDKVIHLVENEVDKAVKAGNGLDGEGLFPQGYTPSGEGLFPQGYQQGQGICQTCMGSGFVPVQNSNIVVRADGLFPHGVIRDNMPM